MKKIPKKKAFVTVTAISLIIAAVVSVLAFMNTKKNNKKCKPMIRGKLDFVLVFHKNKAMLINVKQNKKEISNILLISFFTLFIILLSILILYFNVHTFYMVFFLQQSLFQPYKNFFLHIVDHNDIFSHLVLYILL